MSADLHTALLGRIDEEERFASRVGKLNAISPTTERLARFVLRGLAEDRDILRRHEFYLGPGRLVCAHCGWNPDDPRPCPDQASLLRRHGIEA